MNVSEPDPTIGIPNEEKLPLKDMPEADAVAIFLALLRGETVESRNFVKNCWEYFSLGEDFDFEYVYRIPPQKPTQDTVPWHVFSDEMQWAAISDEGIGFVCSERPIGLLNNRGFHWQPVGEFSYLTHINGYERGTCAPKDSLQRRPDGV